MSWFSVRVGDRVILFTLIGGVIYPSLVLSLKIPWAQKTDWITNKEVAQVPEACSFLILNNKEDNNQICTAWKNIKSTSLQLNYVDLSTFIQITST